MDSRTARSIFTAERTRFAEIFPHVASASFTLLGLSCPPHKPRCDPRDLAWCFPSTGEVYLLQRALALPRANIVALLRHELAHVADPKRSEVEADKLAEIVGGQAIRYDAQGIQTVDRRGALGRPRHLHQ
jgi:hypothetical protein